MAGGAIRCERYVYGKIVDRRLGPVVPGFEHKVTSHTRGFPDAVLKHCDPFRLITETQKASTFLAVHPSAQRRGAFFFLPARDESGRRYMTASCIRARAESGEAEDDVGPGRTYTQYSVYTFSESDWIRHGSWLIATAPVWLTTDPDVRDDRGNAFALPPHELPEGRFDDFHLRDYAKDAVWRMLAGMEQIDQPCILGNAMGVADERAFCKRLAQLLALLPPSLRILLTVACNLSEPFRNWAVQFVPNQDVESNNDNDVSGPAQLLDGDWSANYLDWIVETDWNTPVEARAVFSEAIFEIRSKLSSLAELKLFFCAERDRLPDYPKPTKNGSSWLRQQWIEAADHALRESLNGKNRAIHVERVVWLLSTMTGKTWAKAWRKAAYKSEHTEDILTWSALRATTQGDDEQIGRIPGFCAMVRLENALRLHELGVIESATDGRGRIPQKEFALKIDKALCSRRQSLTERGGDILLANPREATCLGRLNAAEQLLDETAKWVLGHISSGANLIASNPRLQDISADYREMTGLENTLAKKISGVKIGPIKTILSPENYLNCWVSAAEYEAPKFWHDAFSSSVAANPNDPSQMISILFKYAASLFKKGQFDRSKGAVIARALEDVAEQAKDPEPVVRAFMSIGSKDLDWLTRNRNSQPLGAIAKTAQRILQDNLEEALEQGRITPELADRAWTSIDAMEPRYHQG